MAYHGGKRRCAVRDCKFQEKKLFYFPRTAERAEKWREACANPFLNSLPIDKVCAKVVVCKKHFSWDMFVHPLVEKLNRVAVPNLFLPVDGEDYASKINTPIVPSELQNMIFPPIASKLAMNDDLKPSSNDSSVQGGDFGEIVYPESSIFHPVQEPGLEGSKLGVLEYTVPEMLQDESNSNCNNCDPIQEDVIPAIESLPAEMSQPGSPDPSPENCQIDQVITESSLLEDSSDELANPDSTIAIISGYYRYTLCRLCLRRNDRMTNIFENSFKYGFDIRGAIEDEFQFKVSKTDVYPMFICEDCLCKLSKLKRFKDWVLKRKLAFDEELQTLGVNTCDDNSETVGTRGIISLSVEDNMEASQDIGAVRESTPQLLSEVVESEMELDQKNSTHEGNEEISSSNHPKDSADEKDEDLSNLEEADVDVEDYLVDESSEASSSKNIDSDMEEISLEKVFKCYECGEVFKFRNLLTKHLKEHQDTWPVPCQYCDRRFKTLLDLNGHIIMHSNYKPYECEYCGLRSRTKMSLIRHKLLHSDEKPYLCSTCGISFRMRLQLRNHLRAHYGIKLYKCEVCGAEYTTCSKLNAHLKSHSNEKPYVCGQCKKPFRMKISLTDHIRCVHEKIKSFQCDICFKFYSNKRNLKVHKKIHNKEIFSLGLNHVLVC